MCSRGQDQANVKKQPLNKSNDIDALYLDHAEARIIRKHIDHSGLFDIETLCFNLALSN